MLEPISVSLESLNLGTLAPMLVAIAGGLGILVIDLIKKDLDKTLYVMLSVLIIFVDLGVVFGQQIGERGFFDIMLIDGLAVLSQIIILAASMLFIPLALTSKRFHEYSYPEFFALFLFMVAGFQFMVASDNLILIFVGLETASLSLYTLIALHNREKSFEAAIKYFVMGALAAGFYVMGSMLFYALTGSVEIYKIAEVLVDSNFVNMTVLLVAASFIIAAIGFKLSMVPFHTWTPDVYEGANAALAGYMSVVPKIAGFVVAMRLFEFMIHLDVVWVRDILYAAVVVTMTLANIMALVQKDVKRMLAFSSISHAGFVMAAIMIGTTQANSALFLYWILFLFTNLGAFAMLWVSRHKASIWHERFDHPYEKFSGMIQIMPVGAVVMALFMLSLAGVPPFSLFWGKLYIMSAAVNSDYIILALIMAINSAISAYYYLKLIVYMFLKDPAENDGTVYMRNASKPLQTIIGFSVVLTVFAVLAVEPMLEFITNYVQASGF
ncbi:NADH-quinone oxidoreductase subunit NuoN [Hydrogenimonas thermophila]|uniref:NADH-quinone oxidoreductase subunit N n=1 Tax=Hydrogenimonas thermophila TaxID=223786 RepID=A0A1I5N549_9BACT|nr:NADH-quinone oxidoreductase subunit NuoN [Hydrogenimonas thermophila]WOE70283.1 NADH-quinone oxidoreductase subunit NuoN [Hydrogenimonas thermophila]WOE72800.1 NADH-quinone oxidoreductase subunit NuoN [Hydrogenimonas thermophila]SFP16436.1 NADH dehydrogenase subunit N [Hydrogenimonas thermophila]